MHLHSQTSFYSCFKWKVPLMRRLYCGAVFFLSALLMGEDQGSLQVTSEFERIMEIRLKDNLLIQPSMIAYELPDGWYLPLQEFSEAIGVSIKFSSDLGKAEGFLFSESRPFNLDLQKRLVTVGGKRFHYLAYDNFIQGRDVFFNVNRLVEWLPIDLEVDSFNSVIFVHPRENLPIQDKLQRERRARGLRGGGGTENPDYPLIEIERNNLEGPMFDAQVASDHTFGPRSKFSLQYTTTTSGEVLGLESKAFISGNTEGIGAARFNFARREVDGISLGLFKAREIEVFDVSAPSLELITPRSLVKGLLISSFPLYRSDTFGDHQFEGDLLPGWDVELYRNDILYRRLESNEEGRYVFENVPLQYGLNRFRLSFYGPQGQRRDETKTFKIQPDMQKPNKGYLSFGAGLDSNNSEHLVFRQDQNIANFMNLTTGFARFVPRGESGHNNYGLLGVRGFINNAFLKSSVALSDQGGSAYSIGVGLPLRSFVVDSEFSQYFNFTSNRVRRNNYRLLQNKFEFNVSHVIQVGQSIGINWKFEREIFEGDTRSQKLSQRLGFRTGPLRWNHRLIYDWDYEPNYRGILSLNVSARPARFRFSAGYNIKEFESLEADFFYNVNNHYTLHSGVKQLFTIQSAIFNASLIRFFKTFRIGLDVSASSDHVYTAGVSFFMSGARDPRTNRWKFDANSQANSGAASLTLFNDKNYNDIQDDDEPSVKDFELIVQGRSEKKKSDESGTVFLSGLTPYKPIYIGLAMSSIEEPTLIPKLPGVHFYPRLGKTALINFPIIQVGEIEGSVLTGGSLPENAQRGIIIQLMSVQGDLIKEMNSESDGYFIFEKVLPGTYYVQVSPAQLKELRLSASPAAFLTTITKDKTEFGDLNFTIKPQ